MEPIKNLKKLDVFKKKENNFLSQFSYIMEFPLGNRMYKWLIDFELPYIRQPRFGFGNYFADNNIHDMEWGPIQIRFKNLMEGDSNEFYNRLSDWFNDYNHTNQKINTCVHRLNQDGTIAHRWDLIGCFVSAIHYNQTYLEENNSNVEITLHYNTCNIY